MQLITRALPVFGVVLLFAVPAAHAQSAEPAMEKFFVNVNFGYQLADRSLGVEKVLPDLVYEEEAKIKSSQAVGRAPMIDFVAGYRVWGDLFVGVGISRFSNTETASYEATVPDPIFFNRAKTLTGQVDELKRSELAINPHVLWSYPLADKLDVSAAIGVSIIRLSQDLIGTFDVIEPTQNITVTPATEKATGVGPFAQVDFIYNINPMYGVGGFARYAGAKVDLPSSPDQNVGGMIAGAGIRLRF